MHRRIFFKMLGLVPAVALVKPARAKRIIHADDIISDGPLTAMTIQAFQIRNIDGEWVAEPVTYTDSDSNDPPALALLADGTAAVEYQG